MANNDDQESLVRASIYPPSPTMTSSYSYLDSLNDPRYGFRPMADVALESGLLADEDFDTDNSSLRVIPVDPSLSHYLPPPPQLVVAAPISTSAAATAASDAGLLPDDHFAHAVDNPYDHFWMVRNGFSSNLHAEWTSGYKLEKLFREEILLKDDKFRVTLATGTGSKVIGEASVISVGASPRSSTNTSKYYPDFRLPILPSRPEIIGCTGPTQLLDRMENAYQATSTTTTSSWKAFTVYRGFGAEGEVELGTLFEIRQAFQLWQSEVEKWGARTGQKTRIVRRAKKGSGLSFVRGKMVDKETGNEMEDQLVGMTNRKPLKRRRED